MSDPYVGEIRVFGGTFAPAGWLFCDGSSLSIADYEVLYTLIGTTYGGDGQTTFALPDLRGRVPVSRGTLAGGQSYVLGQQGGVEQVTLNPSQTASHTHPVAATGASVVQSPAGANFAVATATGPSQVNTYSTASPNTTLNPASLAPYGDQQPHSNLQPYVAINFIIATQGIYPSPS